jgi:hypothetical protein
MAETFKNARGALTNSLVTYYTAPGGTTSIVLLAQATNVDNTGAQAVDLCWYDSSGTVKTDLVKALSVPSNAAVGLIAGKLVLETGDYIQAKSTASSLIELSLSVLEIS